MSTARHVAHTPPRSRRSIPRILAVSSGGGHWVQLLRLRPALRGADLAFVTVNSAYQSDLDGGRFHRIPDATRWNKFRLILVALKLAWIMLLERPDVVISTGAAPGFFAIRLGRLMRARTIWIDSVANIEKMSLSGELVCGKADLVLTQWPHLAREGAPLYKGSVL
jgi:UDP-N-acetylglucosamine:LPS N-acetylglucosamine transferase